MVGCIALLSGCIPNNDEFSGRNTNYSTEKDEAAFPYYGELKIVQTAIYETLLPDNKSTRKNKIVIVQDEVTGCMYFSTDSITYESLSPLYDETGKVKGCWGSKE